ncbi:hypothetical protein NDU88_001891 [Pleurodeles waltl]|uniref:Uncharacterized protein n=1 Tax=Pleurodeles waltl TaxID=8319 RepID=A0AAV7WJQ1_PLEWA|nr:hypothetical protein NDU88_001891 [Pleurodeles waltl]
MEEEVKAGGVEMKTGERQEEKKCEEERQGERRAEEKTHEEGERQEGVHREEDWRNHVLRKASPPPSNQRSWKSSGRGCR